MLSCSVFMNCLRTIFWPSLGIALVVGGCVPGLAQSNTQKQASFAKVDTSAPFANLARSAGKPSERKSLAQPSLLEDATVQYRRRWEKTTLATGFIQTPMAFAGKTYDRR